MKLPLLVLALLLAVPAATLLPSPALAGMEEEADRQLGFARRELSQGNYSRAIASAESALRLNPAAYEAFLVKALAYEQLGELELASSLLIAYQEITKGQTQDPMAVEAIARIRAARSKGARRARSSAPRAPIERVELESPPAGAIDIASYRDRVNQAITAGGCAVAMATANELTMRAPRDPDGWRLSGDAARCAGATRSAALAYRRYSTLGGDDPRVALMLQGLVESLGILEVVIERQKDGPVPIARLVLPGGEVLAPNDVRGSTLRFEDLPAGVALDLAVVGRGLDSLSVEVPPLAPGEVRAMEAQPHYVGLGTVRVATYEPSLCKTTLVSADGEAEIAPGGSEKVTAGTVTAVVSGDHGEVDVELEVAPGSDVTFDPSAWIPSSLTIVDLPSGAVVRVFVDGMGEAKIERSKSVALFGGRIDPQTGVRLAAPFVVRSLIGGRGGIFVSHPALGEGAGTIVLEPGNVNATTFAWSDMPGVPRVTDMYKEWSGDRMKLRRKVGGQAAVPAVLAIGSLVASGVTLALTLEADKRVKDAVDDLDVAQTTAATNDRTKFAIIAGATAGVAVFGFVITGGVAGAGKRKVAEFGEWNPMRASLPE